MSRSGAPRRNTNAASHGLYSLEPTHRVAVPQTVTVGELGDFARTLAAGALWIAEALDESMNHVPVTAAVPRAVGLYASVAQELHQVAAELDGLSGIKPAALGQLSDAAFENLMRAEGKSLSLILSQCVSASKRIQDRQEVAGMGLIDSDGDVDPVLNYLAGHMRSAKRIIREMAANLAWKERGVDNSDDMVTRILKSINTESL